MKPQLKILAILTLTLIGVMVYALIPRAEDEEPFVKPISMKALQMPDTLLAAVKDGSLSIECVRASTRRLLEMILKLE